LVKRVLGLIINNNNTISYLAMVSKSEAHTEVKIDMDLYSRAIGAFGLEAMQKLSQLSVLVVGQRGLGVETAKDLILSGPGAVAIYDPTIVKIEDLSANFYLTEAHVGKVSRAAACVPILQELNPYVKVTLLEELEPKDCAAYTVSVFTENFHGFSHLLECNEATHAAGKGFILGECLGVTGYAFLDYADKH